MEKITDLSFSSIKGNFAVSDLLGNFNIAEFYGDTLSTIDYENNARISVEPVKLSITNANYSLSNDAINKLLSTRKYVIGNLQTLSDKEPSLINLQDDSIYEEEQSKSEVEIDYYSADQTDAGFVEYYVKRDTSLHNRGVFFMASEIDGNIHLFSLNVLESGQTGKSVSLSYLPNGSMNDAVLLQRVCHHGSMGNEHVNPDGSIINRNDLHIHNVDEDFIDGILFNPALSFKEKVDGLNFPPATIIKEDVNPDSVNISNMVNYAMEEMNISPYILENVSAVIDSFKSSIAELEKDNDFCL